MFSILTPLLLLSSGNWVKAQRDMYSDGMIPDDRVQLLQKIGFNFYHGRKTKGSRGTVSDPWQRRLAELKAYREKAGDTDVPKKFALNLGLGEFVYNQRMVSSLAPVAFVRAIASEGGSVSRLA